MVMMMVLQMLLKLTSLPIFMNCAEGDYSDGLTDLEEYNGKTMPNKTTLMEMALMIKMSTQEDQTHSLLIQILMD